jgi:hypothetical protein
MPIGAGEGIRTLDPNLGNSCYAPSRGTLRRITTRPASSRPATLQLVLPRSIPRTATFAIPPSFVKEANPTWVTSGRGGPSHNHMQILRRSLRETDGWLGDYPQTCCLFGPRGNKPRLLNLFPPLRWPLVVPPPGSIWRTASCIVDRDSSTAADCWFPDSRRRWNPAGYYKASP